MNIGVVLAELGQFKDAEVILKEALRLSPDSIEAICNLGSFYANSRDFDKALLLWQRALKIKPDDETIKQNIERLKVIRGY